MANMRIGEIANNPKYRMDEKFQNCQFLKPNFGFRNLKISIIFLILQFGRFGRYRMDEKF